MELQDKKMTGELTLFSIKKMNGNQPIKHKGLPENKPDNPSCFFTEDFNQRP